MEQIYNGYLTRRSKRIKALAVFLTCIFISIVSFYFLAQIEVLIANVFVDVAFFIFLLGFFYVVTRSWSRENYETMIFVELYRAKLCLDLWRKEDENAKLYLTDATHHIEKAVSTLSSMSNTTISSRILMKQFIEPFKNLQKSIETQILPRVAKGNDIEDMKNVVFGLAQLFSDAYKTATIDDIISKNKDLSRFLPVDAKSIEPSKKQIYWTKFRKSRVAKILGSLALGYTIVTIICLIYVILTQQDFVVFARQQPTILILGGLGISGITFWETR